MREARLSKLLHDLHIYPNSREATDAEHIWQAAYAAGQNSQGRREAHNKGYAAGLERAAEICSDNGWKYCADAIRAEIKGAEHA
jgi:hypothetical protein